jgi:hypothetical protein
MAARARGKIALEEGSCAGLVLGSKENARHGGEGEGERHGGCCGWLDGGRRDLE